MVASARIEKRKIRERVWKLLEEQGVARFPLPVHGRIPNFEGSERAAELLRSLEIWKRARAIVVSPDSPQHPVRERAILEGKILYMPTPRLRGDFVELRREYVPRGEERRATAIRYAFRYGRTVKLGEMSPVDLVVMGSVAVDRDGGRVGKGGGYSDLEYAILRELGNRELPVVTTVHPLQIVDRVPMEPHDVPVDYIVTPDEIIETHTPHPKPRGIRWELVSNARSEGMPVLRELKRVLEGLRDP